MFYSAVRMLQRNNQIIALVLLLLVASCSSVPGEFEESSESLEIYPDYSSVTIPPNIAPMNFAVLNKGDLFVVEIANSKKRTITIRSKNGSVEIPMRGWKRLLEEDRGGVLTITVYR